jgi:phosphoribosyl 1,2-cyclic phosphate phosphodiesterase
MTGVLEFTVLGSGSSGGVPRADGAWGACDPNEPRNRRSRCAFLVRRLGEGGPEAWTTVLVDTAPELRLQTAAAGVERVDAALFTHDHADQTHGLDDLRAFFLRHRVRTPCYMDEPTAARLLSRFGYAFEGQGGYPAICDAVALPPLGQPFVIPGPSGPIPVVGFDQDHGEIRSVGFRFGDVAYSADVVGLPEEAYAALDGVDTWIVDALRDTPHPTHAHVGLALDWIARVKPRRAILTNLHIDLDYRDLARRLPPGVEPAYDGMRFEREI